MDDLTPEPVIRIVRPPLPDEDKMIKLPLAVRLKTFDHHLTPAMRSQIQEEFGDWLRQPQYPVLVGNRMLDVLCTAIKDRSREEALQLLGCEYVEQQRNTLLGVLMFVIRPIVEFERLLRGLPSQYAGATNYGTYSIAPVARRHWRLDFEDDPGYPEFIMGTLQAGGAIIGPRGLRLSCRKLGPQHMSFDIEWD